MIRKILASILAISIIAQTVMLPTYIIANALNTEIQQTTIQMLTNPDLNNNEIIIHGMEKEKEYKLILPKPLQLDTQKVDKNIAYNKSKNEVIITGTGSSVSLFLIASKEGSYQLELKEGTSVEAVLNLVIKQSGDISSRNKNMLKSNLLRTEPLTMKASIPDKLLLQAEASKATLNNYTEQMTISYSINFLDSSSTLKDGKLVIDFKSSGMEPVNYPKNITANVNVKSADYNATTGKLTINLVDNILSGAPFDIPIVVRASYDAESGKPTDLKATLSGSKNTDETYAPVEKAITVTLVKDSSINEYEPITLNDNSWDFSSTKNIYFLSMEGGYNITWPTLVKKSIGNKSFKNLRLEYLKENGAGTFTVRMADLSIAKPGESFWSSLSSINGKSNQTINTTEKQVVEFGPVNANIYNQIQLTVSSTIPKNAVPGTIYTGKVNVYDENILISTLNLNSEVAAAKTDIRVDTEVSKTSISENDIIEWAFTPRISSAITGINDLQIVAPIPEGLETLSFTPNDNMLSLIKKLEYYQNNEWHTLTSNTSNGWDLTKINGQASYRIEKLRITYKDNIVDIKDFPSHSPGIIKLHNTGIKAGDSFILQPESITYTDFDQTNQSIDTTTNSFKEIIQIVNTPPDPPKINGMVFFPSVVTSYGEGFNNTIFFNGDTIAQSVRLASYANELKNPYIFVVVPKGISVTTIRNYIQQPYNGLLGYTYAPSSGINAIYPKSSADISGEETLADGSTLLYWEAPDTSLSPGIKNCEMLTLDLMFKLDKVNSGENRVEFGMGSMTESDWNIEGTGNTGLVTKTLSSELQAKLPGVSSSKYLSTTMTANVGISNSIATTMKIKGSQDEELVNVNSKTATTIPGKKVAYNLEFKNNGTKSMNNLEIIDILPFVGDQYVLGTGNRGSEFSVIPTSEIEVLVNGKKSDTATVEYSTTTTPTRFDINGEDVPGATWQMTAPTNMSTVKSFRIKLPNTEFKVGDQIVLNFEGIVPIDSPLNGEISYNSVAYRVDKETASGITKLASEPPRGGVKSTTPATDLSLSGKSFTDFNKNGVQDTNEKGLNSVELDLYKEKNNEFEKIETIFTSPDSSNQNNGLFDFNGLGNGNYKIAAHLPNKNAEFITTGINKVVVDSKDDTIGWLTKNGSTEFAIDDLANGNLKSITNIQLPIYMPTPVQGAVIFMNKDGERKITSYGEGYQVTLLDEDDKEVKSAVTANNKGIFSFSDVIIQNPVNYKLKVTAPSKTEFVYAPQNTLFNSTTGEYELNNLTPDVGSISEIYITDTGLPSTVIKLDRAITPEAITIDSKDAATQVTNKWTIEDSNNKLIYSGTGKTIRIPNDEGTYTAKNTVTDEAGNTASDEKTFDIDNSAPVLSVNQDASMEVNSTATNINWVNPLIISATDAHDGNLTPTIDYSQVLWNELGTYPVKVTATDTSDNKVTETFNVKVVDTIAPNLIVTNNTLNYTVESMRMLTEQDLFTAAGLVGIDNYDLVPGQTPQLNKLPMIFTSDFSTVFNDISKVKKGQYQVQVNLVDSSNNQAIPQSISIIVKDTKAPVIIADDVIYHVNSSKTETDFLQDSNIKTTDNNDETDDLKITTNFTSKVDLTKPGKYEVTVQAVDTSSNTTTKTIQVQVAKDKPVISADKKISYQGKTSVTETDFLADIQAEVTDELDGNIAIKSDFTEKVNLNKVGKYEVTLNSEDSYGNKANPVIIEVTVYNQISPIFQNVLNQTIEATNKLPSLSTIFNIKSIDYMTGAKIKVTYTSEQPIKGNVPGKYSVKVTTKDTAGNTAETTVTLTIVDTTLPVLIINKEKISYTKGKTISEKQLFQDIEVSAVDNNGTVEVTSNIAKVVNWNKVGDYKLTITATDSSGNITKNTIILTIKDSEKSLHIVPSNQKNGNQTPSPAKEKNMPKIGDDWNTEFILIGVMLLLTGIWLFCRKDTKTK
ncbi:LapB repeat-containing protein [Listeria ivanovii]|uniref:LapB repeat-containing protein n=1 Tax=Listeria ivanovii TaxID=1638 RepID=UPI00190A38D0|nr:LapB repeat-containing protein [Listeria ivanovii]MBK3914770.1 LapB repeat-containing protein [Listeria ivanovii subsp. ivanovii]MBK3922070.1 LapB repeat-containing protein [Listeria ivanovii subsp. ivanovii]MBK3927059.1 LapB repeat-containing protein [Listeria ivanovii subsp. ivanovii]